MTNGKKLGILAGILAILGVAALCVALISPKNKEEAPEITYLVRKIPTEKITELRWDYGGEEITLRRENSDGEWKLPGRAEISVEQGIVKEMLAAVAEVSAFRRLENVENLAQYGLSPANLTVTVVAGEETTFLIGNENGAAGGFYLQVAGEEAVVYLSDNALSEPFQRDENSLAQEEELPDLSAVRGLSLAGDNALTLRYDDSGEKTYTDAVWFAQSGADWVPLDTYATLDVVNELAYLQWEGCADPLGGENLGKYGLDSPSLVAEIAYRQAETVDTGEVDEEGEAITRTEYVTRSLRIFFGDRGEKGVYVTAEGLRGVYFVSQETVELLRNAKVADLRSPAVCPLDWDTVDRLEVSAEGTTRVLEFLRESKTEEGKEVMTLRYTLDGEPMENAEAEEILGQLSAMVAEDVVADGIPATEGDVTLIFTRNTEQFPRVEMHFTQYDSSFYLLTAENEARLLVSKTDLAKWLRLF